MVFKITGLSDELPFNAQFFGIPQKKHAVGAQASKIRIMVYFTIGHRLLLPKCLSSAKIGHNVLLKAIMIFATTLINWLKLVFKITVCADCLNNTSDYC